MVAIVSRRGVSRPAEWRQRATPPHTAIGLGDRFDVHVERLACRAADGTPLQEGRAAYAAPLHDGRAADGAPLKR